jgi:hypothetical protein
MALVTLTEVYFVAFPMGLLHVALATRMIAGSGPNGGGQSVSSRAMPGSAEVAVAGGDELGSAAR